MFLYQQQMLGEKNKKKMGQKSCGMLKNTCSKLSASKQIDW